MAAEQATSPVQVTFNLVRDRPLPQDLRALLRILVLSNTEAQ